MQVYKCPQHSTHTHGDKRSYLRWYHHRNNHQISEFFIVNAPVLIIHNAYLLRFHLAHTSCLWCAHQLACELYIAQPDQFLFHDSSRQLTSRCPNYWPILNIMKHPSILIQAFPFLHYAQHHSKTSISTIFLEDLLQNNCWNTCRMINTALRSNVKIMYTPVKTSTFFFLPRLHAVTIGLLWTHCSISALCI